MMFRKSICACLTIVLLFSCLTGCLSADLRELTCADVVTAYEEAGYDVLHVDTAAEKHEWVCYVRAENEDSGEYIYFHFFDSEDAAKAYAKERQWNVILWLYSVACFQPYWLTTETYGNIEYEYAENAMVKPFKELIN